MSRALLVSVLLALTVAVFSPAAETLLLMATAGVASICLGWDRALFSVFRPPWLRVLFGIAIWGAVSALWSLNHFDALTLSISLVVLFASAGIVFAAAGELDVAGRESFVRWMWFGFAAGAALLCIEVLAEFPIVRAVKGLPRLGPGSPSLGLLGQAFAVMALMLWPLVASAWVEARSNAVPAILAVGALTAVGGNLAAGLALFTGGVVFTVVCIGGRRVVFAFTAIVVAFVATAPVLASFLDPGAVASHFPKDQLSALHRIYTWEFTAERIAERPVVGWGLDSARAIPGSDELVLPSGPLLSLHPHNAALQVWLELGLVGAMALALLVWLVGQGIAGISDTYGRAGAAATFSTALVISFLSFGIWQNWWIASLALTAAFVRASLRRVELSP